MEFEMSDRPDHLPDEQDDSKTITGRTAPENQSPVSPDDYPDLKDRALYIPEEEG